MWRRPGCIVTLVAQAAYYTGGMQGSGSQVDVYSRAMHASGGGGAMSRQLPLLLQAKHPSSKVRPRAQSGAAQVRTSG